MEPQPRPHSRSVGEASAAGGAPPVALASGIPDAYPVPGGSLEQTWYFLDDCPTLLIELRPATPVWPGLAITGVAMAEPLLELREVGRELGMSTAEVTSLVVSGELCAVTVRGQWRVRRSDLDGYVAKARTPPQQDG